LQRATADGLGPRLLTLRTGHPHATISKVLRRHILRSHADSIIACDFFTVEALWLGRFYVLS
jgi:hypothetical protein